MKLFKYTPHICDFLRNSLLKFTPIQQLNDPFEGEYTDRALLSLISLYENHLNVPNDQARRFAESITKNRMYTGIVSLSTYGESIPMLAYYAADFSGGVLEFEVDENDPYSLFESRVSNLLCGDVDYMHHRLEMFDANVIDLQLKKLAFWKHDDWRHEKEIRFVGDFRYADLVSIPSSHRFANKLINSELVGSSVLGSFEKQEDLYLEWGSRWNCMIKNRDVFHPFLMVDSSRLTGVYLGCRFQEGFLNDEHLKKFINLNGNVAVLDLDINNYRFNRRLIR